jgi:hypothetical protein
MLCLVDFHTARNLSSEYHGKARTGRLERNAWWFHLITPGLAMRKYVYLYYSTDYTLFEYLYEICAFYVKPFCVKHIAH